MEHISFCITSYEIILINQLLKTFDELQVMNSSYWNQLLKTFDEFQPLTDEEQALIQKALTIHKKTSLIPCTECKYCIDCPASVNIPEMFKIYNNYMLSKYKDGFVNARKEKSDCDDSLCIECGACMEKCPQKIAIPQRLKEIGALFQEFTK